MSTLIDPVDDHICLTLTVHRIIFELTSPSPLKICIYPVLCTLSKESGIFPGPKPFYLGGPLMLYQKYLTYLTNRAGLGGSKGAAFIRALPTYPPSVRLSVYRSPSTPYITNSPILFSDTHKYRLLIVAQGLAHLTTPFVTRSSSRGPIIKQFVASVYSGDLFDGSISRGSKPTEPTAF